MGDTLIAVVAIALSAVLMFVFPVLTMSDRVDTALNTDIQAMTSDLVNEIRNTGKLTNDVYSRYIERIGSTGNTYDVNLEFKILDENPGKKTIQVEKDKIGENLYYSVFTSQIEDTISKNGVYKLKEGDIVMVTVRNKNMTLAQYLKNFLYSSVGSDIYKIEASESGMVTATATR